MLKISKFFKIYFSLLFSALKIMLILIGTVIALSCAISWVEKINFGDALYFSFITALTIGYGDITPHTIAGKIISVLLGMIGMIFVGIMVSAAIKSLEQSEKDE